MKKYCKWNITDAIAESKKYESRSEFSRNSSRAYELLRKNSLLNIACADMQKPYESTIKWTKEDCLNFAIKYKTRMDFQKSDKKAYEAAKNHGWLDEVCEHMVYKKLPNGYWNNIENCRIVALQYKTKREFIKNYPHVYTKSLKLGWLDEICKHMELIGDRYHRCIYSYEFSDNHVYVGLTCNLKRRQCDRDFDLDDAVTKHKLNSGLQPIRKQLTNYINVNDAILLEGQFLRKYINDGWIALNRNKTGGIGSKGRLSKD